MRLFARSIALLALVPLLAAAQLPSAYRATVLPFGSSSVALNNTGQVAGMVDTRVAIWSGGTLDYLTGAGRDARVMDLNDHGQVVGADDRDAVMWQRGRSALRLNVGELGGVATGINNHGAIVGVARGMLTEWGYLDNGFIWRDGAVTDTGGFFPAAINDDGQIAGQLGPDTAAHWRSGTVEALPDGGYSYATAINQHGWVAGGAWAADGPPIKGAIWKDGVLESYSGGYANALNDAGVAVGYMFGQHAWLWYDGQSYDLNAMWNAADWPGWVLTSAEDINNDGLIVARAQNQASGWAYMTVLLAPVPEPAQGALLLAGLALLGGARLRSGQR